MCLTSFVRGEPASSEAKATPARIGLTVWEEKEPMPTRNRSKLGLNDDHDGIIEIAEHDAPRGTELKPGASFAEIFGLSGWMIDFENKMFIHRLDCFGQLSVAREIAGILGQKFTSSSWYEMVQEFAPGDGSLELTIKNEAPELVPRFMAVAIKNVEIKQIGRAHV